MKQIKTFAILLSLAALTSCSISKYVAPPFTDLDKILELQPGQTVQEVTSTLKIKPYDVVYSHDKGKMILIYNYRVKDRKMILPTKTAGQVIHSENAQRQGDIWYNTNYQELYLSFQDGKLKGIYGEAVLAVGAQVEVMNSRLNNEQQSATGMSNHSNEDLLFAQSVYHERYNRKQAELSEDQAAKNRRNTILGGIGAIAFIVGLIKLL